MLMFKGYKDDSLVEVPKGILYIFHSQFAFLYAANPLDFTHYTYSKYTSLIVNVNWIYVKNTSSKT